MSLVVAAFEPFGGRKKNRAQRAARLLRADPGVEVQTLPVSFARLPAAIDALLRERPAVLFLVGESRTAKTLHVERFALNLAHAGLADNDGAQPRHQVLLPGGPLALSVGIDVPKLILAIEQRGVPVEASAHAGTFCCNAALYWALTKLHPATPHSATRVAFVHVPSRRRHMGAKQVAEGLRAALVELATHTI